MLRRVLLRFILAGAAISGLVMTTSACTKAADPDKDGAPYRLAWLGNDASNDYDNAILAGIKEVAARSQSSVDPSFAGFDPDVQLQQCQDAVASGDYDALLITAASPTGIEPCVAKAYAAGIPVAAIDLPIGPDPDTVEPQVPGEVVACFLDASRFKAGVTSLLPELCAGLDPCNLMYLAGLESFPFDQYGLEAVIDAAATNPAIKLVVHDEALYDTAKAQEITASALSAHPEINVVIASGDQMALGVEQAAKAAGATPRIVGGGAGASAIEAVSAGRWFATYNALPHTEGVLGTELLIKALEEKNTPPVGLDPVEASGLPAWWSKATLAEHPDFVAEWAGP